MSVPSAVLFGRSETGYLVRIENRGGVRESIALVEFARLCLGNSPCEVVVDLNGCDHVDSTFLGALVELHKRFRFPAPRFHVAADATTRSRLLASTRLDRVLSFVDACPEPLAELVSLPSRQVETRDLGRHIMQCHRELAELGGDDSDAFTRIADRLANELIQAGDSAG